MTKQLYRIVTTTQDRNLYHVYADSKEEAIELFEDSMADLVNSDFDGEEIQHIEGPDER